MKYHVLLETLYLLPRIHLYKFVKFPKPSMDSPNQRVSLHAVHNQTIIRENAESEHVNPE